MTNQDEREEFVLFLRIWWRRKVRVGKGAAVVKKAAPRPEKAEVFD
jgi:hypothetical protein